MLKKNPALLIVLLLLLQGGTVLGEEDREVLYQAALLQSLAQGYYDGFVTVGDLKKHGDTGIGTFDGLNGEMIVLDGTVYRAAGDGSVVIPADDETVPFSNVTFFDEDGSFRLEGTKDMAELKDVLDGPVSGHGRNLFCMVRITGTCSFIRVRSEDAQEKPYGQLDTVLAASQREFTCENIRGTLVGLFCPDYMRGLNSAGWHLHFLSEDRTLGGHVLEVSIAEAEASFDMTPGFAMILPEAEAFQALDLAKDMDEAIGRAETASSADVTVGTLLTDLIGAYLDPGGAASGRIDADVHALGTRTAAAVAEHWKKVYLDPGYRLYLYGTDDPSAVPVEGRHAIVVLGYQLKDGEMTEELMGRCDAAAALAQAFTGSLIVCSGGATGENNPEGHTEAGLMKDYLSSGCGIDPDRILTDEKAMTTVDNAVNTFAILKEEGITTMTIVTSSYHQRRGQVLYNALGALYREEYGYSARIVGNYCYDAPAPDDFNRHDAEAAVIQLGRILNISPEEQKQLESLIRK